MQNQSFITRLILKFGLAKNEKQVPIVLIAIIILALVITFIMWPRAEVNNSLPSPAEIEASLGSGR